MKFDAVGFFFSLLLAAYMGLTVWYAIRHDGPVWFWILSGVIGLLNLGVSVCYRFPWWILGILLRVIKGNP